DYDHLAMRRPEWLDQSEPTQNSHTYGQYVDLCCQIASKLDVTLRELDRCLWALDGGDTLPPHPHA
ncbi:MAG: hypothetical protein Q8K89_11805, partial [Actinomycetota bacterium]|nr:hypothetical protein [Actinomycetota bacterium]